MSWNGIGFGQVLDIALMALLIYGLLVWLKRTRRAALIIGGIVIVALVYLLARQFDLRLTVAVLQGFFAVILIALIVIFQEELRLLFERVAQWSLGRRRALRRQDRSLPAYVDVIVETLSDLSQERIGALIVIRGRDPLVRHVEGGEALGGEISEALLKSLFDPHSMGHDGAAIVEGGSLQRFGCLLPLSKNRQLLRNRGTRHAAALGLSELSDALCIVVSEERGAISIARHGGIRTPVDANELRGALADFLRETAPGREPQAWRRLVTHNLREKLIAAALAAGLWFVLVHEAQTVYRSFVVPVDVVHVPSNARIARIEPPGIEVTLSAPRKSMYFVRTENMHLTLRGWDLEPGTSRISVTAADVVLPRGLALENFKPRTVQIELHEVAE